MQRPDIKPSNKAVRDYYKTLEGFDRQSISHETAVRAAFQNLLADTAKVRKWTLIPELGDKVDGRTIRPDGTLRDTFHMPRGYWEAKDTADDLDAEIKKKIAKGYPINNTIFEDTCHAVLFQNKQEVQRFDLSVAKELTLLLNTFYSHEEPNIEQFEKAVDEFKIRVPDLARSLTEKIGQAHKDNKKFIAAFGDFFGLCKNSLNPNISKAAVDEMLVQHLLTRRLFQTIIDNPDFVHRNAIAAEVEKVIDALASKSFSLHEFLKSLDQFYVAIESAAHGLTEFGEKQHFLNTVYERFFQGYSVRVADTHGIVYTPQPIVDFMCASVEEVLKSEFGKSLGSKDVNILDPCTGTGNFIVNLLRRVQKRDLKRVYGEQLFANEVMLMPYYIAALNIEHEYYVRTGEYESFDGLCFVDTLDMAEPKQTQMEFMTEKNTARVNRQKKTPITVIIGNPPYNVGQINENDNNKNRKYKVIDKGIKDTYAKDSKATNKNALSDAYVKFFRWATNRLEGRDGIVCFVSNNSFVDQIAFDGMRKHLLQDFTQIYHVDLHGNVRKNPKLSGTTHNVFGIQVGVGITVAVRKGDHKSRKLVYERVPEFWRKEEKLDHLRQMGSVGSVKWTRLRPDSRFAWLTSAHGDEYEAFIPLGTKEAKAAGAREPSVIFKLYSGGVKTNRDTVVYDFDRDALIRGVKQFIEDYNSEVDRYQRADGKPDVDSFVKYDKIKWSESLKNSVVRGARAAFIEENLRVSTYRPFLKLSLFFDALLNERRYQLPVILPTPESEADNRLMCVSGIGSSRPFQTLIVSGIPCLDMLEKTQCFPFYVYDENGSNRRENITDWALKTFREHYNDKKIGKWDIFNYVYGLLHHPVYCERYADCLKRELPRIPFAPDFRAFAEAGKRLAGLHLDYEKIEPYELEWIEAKGIPLSYRVDDKIRLSKDKSELKVNDSLTLGGIPKNAFEYRLGNRSALDWVIDQYRIKTDKRSGILSDPNRPDDEEYIVRLVGQVINVSIETMKIVRSLPVLGLPS
ncbi:MAG: N-6 DNA methylase [candidate division Zixibacteria bacterium]|nr:N-6 DNA methylase [candidate division Zixibacteria bacterium]MBU1471641.1 N-6 DNA methylase [candidate division Zixibacteria bacterium]